MPSITQLKYIESVVKYGHFGKAAEACFVSQPTLSAQIQKVETEFGITFFNRDTKPVSLTPDGQRLMPKIQTLLETYNELEELSASAQSDTLSGTFKIGIIPTISPYLIPLFIADFSEKYPDVDLHLYEYKTDIILRELAHNNLDAGILATPIDDSTIQINPLYYEPFYIYASSKSPLYKKKEITRSDINPEDLWLLTEGHCFRNQMLNLCTFAKTKNALPNVSFESGSLETLINLVRQSSGYTFLPYLATQFLPEDEQENAVKPFQNHQFTREVSLIYKPQRLKAGHLAALTQTIRTNIPKQLMHNPIEKYEIVPIEKFR